MKATDLKQITEQYAEPVNEVAYAAILEKCIQAAHTGESYTTFRNQTFSKPIITKLIDEGFTVTYHPPIFGWTICVDSAIVVSWK